jgi:hypothetical protein
MAFMRASSVRYLATGTFCGVGAALALPEWLPLGWTREDGPIETTGFATFVVASVLALAGAWLLRSNRRQALAALALAAVLLFAAGEEISWGQRVLDVDTPAAFVDGNQQDELNLHNLAGLQHKAILGQLAIAAAGVWLPRFVRGRWARAGVPFFAGYLVYRGSRGVAAVAGWGPAGRNSEAAELLLALGLLALTATLVADARRGRTEPAAGIGRHPAGRSAGVALS